MGAGAGVRAKQRRGTQDPAPHRGTLRIVACARIRALRCNKRRHPGNWDEAYQACDLAPAARAGTGGVRGHLPDRRASLTLLRTSSAPWPMTNTCAVVLLACTPL